MSALPSGTITMLFTDIESSTLALRRLGEHWGEALSAHREILREVFARHGGHEMGTEGDSFFVVFTSAHEAVLAAAEGQQRLHDHAWPYDVAIKVRMGVHTGEPTLHDDGYVGIDLHRAGRIRSTSHGGQIVLSEATRQLVVGTDDPYEWRDLGWHRLKDFTEPEHLYDLVVPGVPSDFPPLKTLGTLANLPSTGTTMIGRETELAELSAELGNEHVRLVTLTGTGGSGKTRLAIAAAAAMEDEFTSGIFFVPLHTTNRAALMWAAVADAVGATGESDERPEIRTRRFLLDRQALLLLDNLEQIPDADDVVSDLLNSAPDIKILATSRRPLHLIAEHEFPVRPLDLPSSDLVAQSVAERAAAVELFVTRARMVQPRFELTPHNTADVIRLCRRLDGLPLAIELAAARSRFLSPKALLGRIDDSLGVGVTASDRAERQRTLGKTIAWSYDLLSPADQQVFRQLGVFARAFDLSAVEAVVDTDGVDPLDVVARLIDANLLQASEGSDGEPRVAMLQTIRSYARKMMKTAGERVDMRLRHARWCLDMATDISEGLHGAGQMDALDRMATIQHDIRTALDWCVRPPSEVSEERRELGYQIISQMNTYWHRFGYVAEGRGWQQRAIAMADDEDSAGLIDALHGMAVLDIQANDISHGIEALTRGRDMAQRLGDLGRESRETNSLGVAHRSLGDTDGARALLERAIELARQSGNKKYETTALSNMAVLLIDIHDYPGAVETGRLAVAADLAQGDQWGAAINRINLAYALLLAEGPDAAYEHLVGCAQTSIDLGDPELSIATLEMLAVTLAERGDATRAALLMGTADTRRAKIGMPRSPPDQVNCERSLDLARTLITRQEWAAASSRGSGLKVEEALAEALSA